MHDDAVTHTVQEAVERTYREDGARLWRAILMYSGDQDVASDAVAEAFTQALARGDAIRDTARWVWRSAFRIAAGELQRRRRYEPLSDEAIESTDTGPLWEALGRLSPRQRAAVVLRHFAGYDSREAAEIMGSTDRAVRVHLHRARKRLRDLLTEAER